MAFPNDISIEVKKNPNEELWNAIKDVSKELTAYSQTDLLLLCFGTRPVAEICVQKVKNTDLSVFDKHGLFVAPPHKENNRVSFYFVSKEEKFLQEVIECTDMKDGSVKHDSQKRFGELMGYPESATESWANGVRTSTASFPEVFGYDEFFFSFSLSNPPTEEEITYLVRANRLLLKYLPELSEKTMGSEDAEEYIKDVKAFLEKYSNLE